MSILPALLAAGLSSSGPPIQWVDALSLGLGGVAYRNYGPNDAPYARLPSAAQSTVPPAVWGYSRDAAGLFIQFTSNASAIHLNYSLASPTLTTFENFSPLGYSGCDLYVWDDSNATWRWVASTFDGLNAAPRKNWVVTESPLFAASDGWPVGPIPPTPTLNATFKYRLHLPSYNGVTQMSVGWPVGASLAPDASWNSSGVLPLTYYGTSIAQGGVTSRPGQTFVSRLSRLLDMTVNNMGFCGACRMELALAQWLAAAPSMAYVVDCGWNMAPADISAAAVPFLNALRAGAPDVPIVLVEPTPYPPAWILGDVMNVTGRRAELAAAYANVTAAGMQKVYYVPGSAFYNGAFGDPTYEGVHPLDYGHALLAHALANALGPILGRSVHALQEEERVALPAPQHVRRDVTASAADVAARVWPPLDARVPRRQDAPPANATWMPGTALTIQGRAFNDTPAAYNRLPVGAQKTVRAEVWGLGLDSAGVNVAFNTSCANIYISYTCAGEFNPMVHFSATGVSGADLYAWDPLTHTHRFVAPLAISFGNTSSVTTLASGLPTAGETLYTLFIATYNEVTDLSIGVDAGCSLGPAFPPTAAATAAGPVVWYGTSILQGGVDTKVGNIFSSVVARTLMPMGVPLYNFGFSGNCLMETDVTEWLVTVQPTPSVFIVDCNHNMDPAQIAAAAMPLYLSLRAALPDTHIVLAEGTEFGRDWIVPASETFQSQSNAALYAVYANASGSDPNLSYVTTAQLFAAGGTDALDNPTAAGLHPNDAGMNYVAQLWTTYLGDVLAQRVRR